MLTVHHLGSSQSERIVWLCEELEIPYELIRYEREPSFAAPPEYKALSAYGTAPVITDDDFALGESGAIIEYVCQRYAGGRLIVGQQQPEFADFLFWFHFANASMVAGIMADFAKSGGLGDPGDRTLRSIAIAEQRLGDVPYFAGDSFTAADIMMFFPLRTVRRGTQGQSTDPNIAAYIERISARPAYIRALAKAEPDGPMRIG